MTEQRFSIPGTFKGFKGYRSDPINAQPEYLCPPSINTLISDGEVETRLGMEAKSWDLGQSGKPATSFYHRTYDITFFAVGTKVKYLNHATNVVYDTGITLTDGTTTRFAEYCGDVYLTNTTDGIRRIVCMKLNSAVSAGAATITVDVDGSARLSVFSITTGNLRINGTNEAFSSLVAATGVITLTGTASQGYDDNTVAIVVSDISSGREKFSKLTFWKERMTGMGSVSVANADQPNASVFFSKFTVRNVLENIIDFTYGAGGSTVETVGKSGRITNLLPTEDYLYIFKETESYVISVADVNSITGESIPNLRSPMYGCVSEDCAVDMGNGEVAFITNDRRLLRIKIATDSGAAVVFPDESFDQDIQEDLNVLDSDQDGAFTFYHRGSKRAIFQVKLDGTWTWLIYDNSIRAWQPPQYGRHFKSLFERNGVLYGTDAADDTIYQLDSTYSDNGASIEHKAYTGVFDVDDSHLFKIEAKGTITPQTTLYYRTIVNNTSIQSVTPKVISGASFAYPTSGAMGATITADIPLGSSSVKDTAEWKKNFDIFPRSANKVQLGFSSFGPSNSWTWKYWMLSGVRFSKSFTKLS